MRKEPGVRPAPSIAILEAAKPTRERTDMSPPSDDFVRQVEHVVNGLAAELTVQKKILQLLIAHMLVVTPMLAEETLNQLKSDVEAALRRSPGLSDQTADRRVVELPQEHGDRFFRELSAAVAAIRNRGEQFRH
jgi:hypothetical protein